MNRRAKIAFSAAVAAIAACHPKLHAEPAQESHAAGASSACRCLPEDPCWPKEAEWRALAANLTGKLEQPRSPVESCRRDAASEACARALEQMENPFAIQAHAGGTQSSGWLEGWSTAQSEYAIAAETAEDIAAGVDFARDHDLRLAIKSTGHDYLGRSTAPKSLLIWTYPMREVKVVDSFVPHGCPPGERGSPAVIVEAGARWGEVYREVTVKHGRYAQGGGCTTVGAAGGFVQGGGFGNWSKKYGTSAAGVLEAKVVTADGEIRIANRCQNQDLFWALRGGGGGTFGVVTELAMMTHPLPKTFGLIRGEAAAQSDAGFRRLLEKFVEFYRRRLSDEHWGQVVRIEPDNRLSIELVFADLSEDEARQIWTPFRAWIEDQPEEYSIVLHYVVVPADKVWDPDYLDAVLPGFITRAGLGEDLFFWTQTKEELNAYWYAYESRWLPLALFRAPEQLAALLFEASRFWPVGIHFQKGQAGAAAEAVARGRETSMNPAVFDAAGLIILASSANHTFPGVAGREPDAELGRQHRAKIEAAMKLIREATPGAGTYGNQASYFQADWARELWGENYPRLLAIKNRYDPRGLFHCHHCVGSERWTADGMCRIDRGPD